LQFLRRITFLSFYSLILQLDQKMYHTLATHINNENYLQLKKEYSFFEFQSYNLTEESDCFRITFNFNLANKFFFQPQSVIWKRNFFEDKPQKELLDILAFHIGMVELISYWKAACPPLVVIKPFKLTKNQIIWWKKLYFNGLGEFFYLNKIEVDIESFMKIESDSENEFKYTTFRGSEKVIVPVGGGKDSVVSLEILDQNNFDIIPLIVNPREASAGCAASAGFLPEKCIIVERSIDSELIRLNGMGFLNGHTPFSALLAFTSAFAAVLSGTRNIALSNESSASESTVPETNINHQYSKSIEFEEDFRSYLYEHICSELNYFSLLRPLNELQIASIFSKLDKYHSVFKSCNVGSKKDIWCCTCPKCLFTWIILSPFLSEEKLNAIFGNNLLENKSLQSTLDELLGKTTNKPFECVGAVAEIEVAVNNILIDNKGNQRPLLEKLNLRVNYDNDSALKSILRQFDSRNFLDSRFEKIVKSYIYG
jgi:UDP-N-acetyl-alpha-D-muramoyl-L-alanyl-L-glutamate epimerase